MANTIRIKRRASGGSAGAPSSLFAGELAYNEQDTTLYIGEGTGGAGGTATTIRSIAGPGAFATLGTTQTFTGAKTFSSSVALGSSATATTPSTSDNSTTVARSAATPMPPSAEITRMLRRIASQTSGRRNSLLDAGWA